MLPAATWTRRGHDRVQQLRGDPIQAGTVRPGHRVAEINEAAARIFCEARGAVRWVIASMGPMGKMLVTDEVTEEELYAAFKEQAMALAKGGAQALCIETMSQRMRRPRDTRGSREHGMRGHLHLHFPAGGQGLFGR